MNEIDILLLLRDIRPIEIPLLMKSLFSLDCLKDSVVRESILQLEEDERWDEVLYYSEEEVFSKYMEYREQIGKPLDLAEYLANRLDYYDE